MHSDQTLHWAHFGQPRAQFLITITRLCKFDSLKLHFCIVKLGFTGVYIIFLISAQKHSLWYSLEPPRRGGSNEYHSLCFEQKYEDKAGGKQLFQNLFILK